MSAGIGGCTENVSSRSIASSEWLEERYAASTVPLPIVIVSQCRTYSGRDKLKCQGWSLSGLWGVDPLNFAIQGRGGVYSGKKEPGSALGLLERGWNILTFLGYKIHHSELLS